MKNAKPNLLSTLASLIALGASACSAEPDGDANGPVLLHAETFEITDLGGQELTLTLLPNSSADRNGDARYFVKAGARDLEISRVVAPEGSEYLEVLENNALIGALELDAETATLRGADGAFLFSNTGELPAEQAVALVEPLALTLLDQSTLERFDQVLRGPGEGEGEGEIGTARQALRIKLSGSCAVECSNWGVPTVATCCCGVGQRCRSLLDTCVCEDASRPLTNTGALNATTGAGIQLMAR
jgi:hypothetical protein